MKPPKLGNSAVHDPTKPTDTRKLIKPIGVLRTRGRPRKSIDKRNVKFY